MALFHTVPQLVAAHCSLLSVQVSTLVVELSCNTFWIVEEKRLSTEHIRTWYNGQHNVMSECSANKQMVTEKQHSSSMSEFIQHTLPTVIHVDSCSSVCLWLSQVLVASARAHLLIKKYSVDVVSATPAALRRLLAWKETRVHQELRTDSTDSIATAWYWILLFFKKDSMVEGKYRKKPSAQLFSLAFYST